MTNLKLSKNLIIYLLFFLIVSNSLTAQNSTSKITPKEKKFLDSISKLENHGEIDNAILNINSALDTVSKNNYILKLALYDKLFYLHRSTNDFENCYRVVKQYDVVSQKFNDAYYNVRAHFFYCIFFKDIEDLNKFYFHLDQIDKIFTDDLQRENPSTSVHYNLQRISQAKSLNDTLKWQYYIDKNLELYKNIDHNNKKNYYLLAQIATNYADFVDIKDQDMSLKYYTISNNFAHKLNNINLINFNRMRIAGCLLNKGDITSALDSLRLITKSNKDVNITYLHYHSYIDIFNRLNIPDSVKVYQDLANEIDAIFKENASKVDTETKVDYSGIVDKVDLEFQNNQRRNYAINFALVITFILGLITVFVIIKKINLLDNK